MTADTRTLNTIKRKVLVLCLRMGPLFPKVATSYHYRPTVGAVCDRAQSLAFAIPIRRIRDGKTVRNLTVRLTTESAGRVHRNLWRELRTHIAAPAGIHRRAYDVLVPSGHPS